MARQVKVTAQRLIFADLRSRRRPIPVNDVWIAASTISAGAHLVSFDRHFENVNGLDHTLLE